MIDKKDFFKIKGHPTNKSTSKQLYSMPKSKRFNYKNISAYSFFLKTKKTLF